MITIPAVRECCAGIDVGKRGIAVAVMKGPADKEAAIQTRWLGTTVPELEALREWLAQEGVTSVAMESAGSYWIPIKNVWKKRRGGAGVFEEASPEERREDRFQRCHPIGASAPSRHADGKLLARKGDCRNEGSDAPAQEVAGKSG